MTLAETGAALERALAAAADLLYQPVLGGLVLLCPWVLLACGQALGEQAARLRGRRWRLEKALGQLDAAACADGPPALDVRLETVVQACEVAALAELDRIRWVVRAGPALGLMGTLIPMGMALAGLAQGDLPKMGETMVTAFAATVVGLACSLVAYLVALVREHWLRRDMLDLAHAAELRLAAGDRRVRAAA